MFGYFHLCLRLEKFYSEFFFIDILDFQKFLIRKGEISRASKACVKYATRGNLDCIRSVFFAEFPSENFFRTLDWEMTFFRQNFFG